MSTLSCFRDRPWVDGTKVFAVISVVLLHGSVIVPDSDTDTGLYAMPLCGLDLCFILSGFLITLWCMELAFYTNKISPLLFAATRAWKILPPVLVVLLFSVFAFAPVANPQQMQTVWDTLYPDSISEFYWMIASTQPTDWVIQDAYDDPLDHLWPVILLVHIYVAHVLLCIGMFAFSVRVGEVYLWLLVLVPLVLLVLFIFTMGVTDMAVAIWYSAIPAFDFAVGACVAVAALKLSQHRLGREKREDEESPAARHREHDSDGEEVVDDGHGRERGHAREESSLPLHSPLLHVRLAQRAGDALLALTYEPALLSTVSLAALMWLCFFAMDHQLGWDAVTHAATCAFGAAFLFAEEWYHVLHGSAVRQLPTQNEKQRTSAPHRPTSSAPAPASAVTQRALPYDGIRLAAGLEFGPLRFLGARIFLIYLWHWPLIVIGDLAAILPEAVASTPQMLLRVFVIATCSVALAVITDDLIINPLSKFVRFTTVRDQAKVLAACAVAAVVVVALIVLFATPQVEAPTGDGDDIALYEEKVDDEYQVQELERNENHGPVVLLIGDTTADALHPLLEDIGADHGFEAAFVDLGECPDADLPIYKYRLSKNCAKTLQDAVHAVERIRPFLVLVQTLRRDFPSWKHTKGFVELMGDGMKQYHEKLMATGVPVVIVGPAPIAPKAHKQAIKDCTMQFLAQQRQSAVQQCSMPANLGGFHDPLRKEITEWCGAHGCKWMEVGDILCPQGACPGAFNDGAEWTYTYESKIRPNSDYYLSLRAPIEKRLVDLGVKLDPPAAAA